MEIDRFFYKLYLADAQREPVSFLGSAFPIAPGGGLLTCRHAVEVEVPDGHAIAVLDPSASALSPIAQPPVLIPDRGTDMAFLPNALAQSKTEFFPILSPQQLQVGSDVFCFGFFSIGRGVADVERGYFAGKIVNLFGAPCQASMLLPFPVLEGMSGSPVLTYHNGPKLVGLAIGNRSSRILASEVLEFKDEKREVKETVSRIVEFGVAYDPVSIIRFLAVAGVKGSIVSHDRVDGLGLE